MAQAGGLLAHDAGDRHVAAAQRAGFRLVVAVGASGAGGVLGLMSGGVRAIGNSVRFWPATAASLRAMLSTLACDLPPREDAQRTTLASFHAPTDKFVAPLWIPAVRGPRRYFVRVEVKDGRTLLAMADSGPFAGLR